MKQLNLTALDHEAEASWQGVIDLATICPTGWSLAGGQAVFVQTMLRGMTPARPSSDADLVIDIRSDSRAAANIVNSLTSIGFEGTLRDSRGRIHRWVRGDAQIDVLQPRHLGERAEKRLSRAGHETIAAPGSQHLLFRTEDINVTLGDKAATVRTPTALGILVAKAAAFQEIIEDPHRVRHLADILTVGPLISARDLREENPYSRLEKQRVGNAVGQIRNGKYTTELQSWFPSELADLTEDLAAMHKAHSARPRHGPSSTPGF